MVRMVGDDFSILTRPTQSEWVARFMAADNAHPDAIGAEAPEEAALDRVSAWFRL
jgi:hypothetical protein